MARLDTNSPLTQGIDAEPADPSAQSAAQGTRVALPASFLNAPPVEAEGALRRIETMLGSIA